MQENNPKPICKRYHAAWLPPGTGKTHFTKCLGNEAGYELFILEVAELFGKFVGDSELMIKNAIDVIRANSPCCVCIDEVDKALAGVGGG